MDLSRVLGAAYDYAAARPVVEAELTFLTVAQLQELLTLYGLQKASRKDKIITTLLKHLDHLHGSDRQEAQAFISRCIKADSCAKCHRGFQKKSFGTDYPFNKELCFACMTEAQDPFYTVVDTLAGPVTTPYKQEQVVVSFTLSRPLHPDERVWVRPFRSKHEKYNRKQHHLGMPRSPPHCWPLKSTLMVNLISVPIRQGEWKQCGQSSVFKGESQAVDITERVVAGRETEVKLKYSDPVTHWLVVQVLKKKDVADVVAESRGASQQLSVAEGRAFVQQALGTDGGDTEHGKATDDDVVCVAVSKPLSLRCVLTAARLQDPARAKDCRHLECFNFEPLVRSMERACPGTYRCPVCRAPLTLDELVLDGNIKNIMSEVDEEIETIEVQENGDWTPKLPLQQMFAKKRKAAEDVIDIDD